MTEYKPLTDEFRKQILDGLDKQIEEAKQYNSAYSMMTAKSCEATKELIKSLPDYFPIPIHEVKEGEEVKE